MVDQPTSLTLLERVRAQRPDAWFQLVFLYAPLVECWCRGWGVPGADVEDLRQGVFQSVVTGLASFPPRPARATPFAAGCGSSPTANSWISAAASSARRSPPAGRRSSGGWNKSRKRLTYQRKTLPKS